MKEYLELKKQKEEITKKLEEEKKKIRHVILKDIKEKIDEFSFSASELGFSKENTTTLTQKSNKPKASNKNRKIYKNPEDDKVWTGKGPTPAWLKKLELSGRSREEFEVKDEQETNPENLTQDQVENTVQAVNVEFNE